MKQNRRICAHHKKPWQHYPELRYDLNNGQTLCRAAVQVLCPSCGYDSWIVFPLYNRCQSCGHIVDRQDGWRWLLELQREITKRNI